MVLTSSILSLPRLPARSYFRNNDLEKGYTTSSDKRKLPVNQRHDVSSTVAVPRPVYTTGVLATSSNSAYPSRGSSASTLAVDDLTVIKSNQCFDSQQKSQQEPAPKYRYHWMNMLRWEWLSVYRRLNLIVLFVNILIVVIFAAQGKLLSMDPEDMSTALAANITTAVVFRQEYVVNLLFLLFGCVPPSWPLWFRRLAAKIYHFGGVHSGAGMASLIWLALFDMSLALQYWRGQLQASDIIVLTVTGLLNLLLLIVVVSSHPTIRERYHNIWELIHRFGGWLSVALFWVNFGILSDKDRLRSHPEQSIPQMLLINPVFWMLFVITFCLALPWFRLRKVAVKPEAQSKYGVRLHFSYTNLPLCAAPRFSTSPFTEWHSFAGIPHEDGIGFSVLISGIGDWTRKMTNEPPLQLWTRGIPVRGVLHIAPIFKKIVLVATGSGIGPVLSLLYARDVNCRILWCTRDPRETYAPSVVEAVLRADPKANIISRVRGQRDPDLGELAYRMYRDSGAEAVFIISNKEGCTKGRVWLESRGVAVFSPIFDS